MSIVATTPTVIPSVTYDQFWITNITINGADPNAPVGASATLQKCLTLPDNVTIQLSPVDPVVTIVVDDIIALAASNPTVGAAFTNLVAAITALGQAQGLI